MSHSERNLTRTPSVKREMLTFTVTLQRLPGLTRTTMQQIVHEGLKEKLVSQGYVEAPVVTKLHAAHTVYGDE